MEVIRIEESNKYGYLIKHSKFEKFFDDAITNGKDKCLECVKNYLLNIPKLYPNKEEFHDDEFKEYCEIIKFELNTTNNLFNDIKIISIVNRLKIKSGIKTTFWELMIIDNNKVTHTFDYNLTDYPTKQSVVDAFNLKYNLNLTYSE